MKTCKRLLWHDTITIVVVCTIAEAKVQLNYNCYNVYFNGCLHYPKGEIDHIDGDRLNNRIENLRDVNSSQNQLNKRLPWNVNPLSHLPGVVRDTSVWKNKIQGKNFHSADKYGLFHLGILLGKTYQADNP